MNVVDVLLGRGAAEAPALVGEQRTVTYGELADVAARLGGELAGRGLEPGDRVAIGSGNDTAFVAAYLAALHVGAIAVPLNPSAPPSELGRELSAVQRRASRSAAGPAAPMLSAAGADVVTVDIDALRCFVGRSRRPRRRRRRGPALHVGHRGRAEGGDAHARQPARRTSRRCRTTPGSGSRPTTDRSASCRSTTSSG